MSINPIRPLILSSKLKALDVQAHHIPLRADIAQWLRDEAKSGDRIVIMGARDDTLTDFAKSVL